MQAVFSFSNIIYTWEYFSPQANKFIPKMNARHIACSLTAFTAYIATVHIGFASEITCEIDYKQSFFSFKWSSKKWKKNCKRKKIQLQTLQEERCTESFILNELSKKRCTAHSLPWKYFYIQVLMTYLLRFNISMLDVRLMVLILKMVSRLVRWCIRCKRDWWLKLWY